MFVLACTGLAVAVVIAVVGAVIGAFLWSAVGLGAVWVAIRAGLAVAILWVAVRTLGGASLAATVIIEPTAGRAALALAIAAGLWAFCWARDALLVDQLVAVWALGAVAVAIAVIGALSRASDAVSVLQMASSGAAATVASAITVIGAVRWAFLAASVL